MLGSPPTLLDIQNAFRRKSQRKRTIMKLSDLLCFWKAEDEDDVLTNGAEQTPLPPNPVGQIELSEDELTQVSGGTGTCWPLGQQQPRFSVSYSECFQA